MAEFAEGQPINRDIPIIDPDELERRLEDNELSGRVAAVTTTSIDAVRRLLADPSHNFPANKFGYVNLDLVDEVFDELTGRKKLDKITPSQTIQDNAESYGHWQAAIGLLYEKGVPVEKIRTLIETSEFQVFTEMALNNYSDNELDQNFSSYEKISASLYRIWDRHTPLGFDYNRECETALKDIFPRARDVNRFLKSLRGREGVQLLLGDRAKFGDFVLDNRSEQIDTSGIKLHSDIPRSLIIGIVPRGQVEQQELSSF